MMYNIVDLNFTEKRSDCEVDGISAPAAQSTLHAQLIIMIFVFYQEYI